MKKTPCVGLCSTTYGDDVCRGCLRPVAAVLDWSSYTQEQKDSTQLKIEAQVENVLKLYIEVSDSQAFIQQIVRDSPIYFSHNFEPSAYYLLFQLIQMYPEKLKNYKTFFRVLRPLPSLKDLCSEIFAYAIESSVPETRGINCADISGINENLRD